MAFETELVLEGVEDGLDALAQGTQEPGSGARGLVAGAGRSRVSPAPARSFELFGAVALVRHERLVAGGLDPGEHVAQDLALIGTGIGKRPRYW